MNTMTPRERWIALFNNNPVDRLTSDYWGTQEITDKVNKHVGGTDEAALCRALDIDSPRTVYPEEIHIRHTQPGEDNWGVHRTLIDYGTGHYMEADGHPLANFTSTREIEQYDWPRAEDFDYTTMVESLRNDDGQRLIRAGEFEPFWLYNRLRGMEQGFMDLLENHAIAECILEQVFHFHYEYNRSIFQAAEGKIDLLYMAEDLGGQNGPLFSLETYRRFFLPNQKRMADLAREYGVHVFYHTDGAARDFIPDLIDVVGIDILNPLQWRCPGMSLPELARDFGRHVIFHGGVDNQHTLPFGTPEDVRNEVLWIHDVMSKHHARWICAPCHKLQSVTPVENVLALYQTVHEINDTKH
ncbi:MAG: hypothetical protein IT446_13980 [Phycisphaerales bacterium]|nr:hypothetical protein [Phycisphaerales bacterium]